jgi:hypothetical protein
LTATGGVREVLLPILFAYHITPKHISCTFYYAKSIAWDALLGGAELPKIFCYPSARITSTALLGEEVDTSLAHFMLNLLLLGIG